jgi:hypothetical protein
MHGTNMKVYDEVCFQNNAENVNNIQKYNKFQIFGKGREQCKNLIKIKLRQN